MPSGPTWKGQTEEEGDPIPYVHLYQCSAVTSWLAELMPANGHPRAIESYVDGDCPVIGGVIVRTGVSTIP
jgi:hypothetical protein